jgi:AmmeMemoRadiSam system protein A
MSGALDGKQIQSELLSYEGPFGVGYSVGAFSIMGEDKTRIFDKIYEKEELLRIEKIKNQESPLVALARKSLETYVKTKKQIHRPDNLPSEMISKKAGVFVSLKMDGMLRGCIGTISPVTDCIADEIIQNAVSSGVNDPRFNRVEESELPRLVYSVDVLKEAEPISSISELDVLRYGVIVRSKGRCGLLLPNLEGVDSPESQIDIALRKAGIPKQEPYSMERFEVVRYK